jgi:ubiquinone/menaquinone biosynthesis C-methylase UbiE
MVAPARRSNPGLRFEEGSMTALDLPDGALGGIVAMYSIIHIPRERLPEVFAEFHRVLAPGGHRLTRRAQSQRETMPSSASAASTSSREIPRRYRIESR